MDQQQQSAAAGFCLDNVQQHHQRNERMNERKGWIFSILIKT